MPQGIYKRIHCMQKGKQMFSIKLLNHLIPRARYKIELTKSMASTIQQYHSEGLLDINRYAETCLQNFINGFEDTLTANDFELGMNLENSNTAILRVRLSHSLSKRIKDISRHCTVAPEAIIATVIVMSFSELISSEIIQDKPEVSSHEQR